MVRHKICIHGLRLYSAIILREVICSQHFHNKLYVIRSYWFKLEHTIKINFLPTNNS